MLRQRSLTVVVTLVVFTDMQYINYSNGVLRKDGGAGCSAALRVSPAPPGTASYQFLRALSFESMRVRQVALPGSQKGLHKWTVQLLIKITSDFEEPAPNTSPFLLRDKILIFSKL